MTAAGLRFGYGTNGFADHRLTDALSVLAGLGYDGVALTLDHQHLDPYARGLAPRVRRVARDLRRTGLAVVVETGARYLLDPLRKHRPTLVSAEPEGRAARLGLLRRAIRIGAELEAEAVHFWSGTPDPGTTREQAWQRLEEGCAQALDEAERAGVDLAFEPEPGMLVEDLAGYRRLLRSLGGHDRFRLTLDIGHCRCLEPWPEARCVELAADRLAHVQIEDMRRGVHEHLPFGAGEIDFPPVLRALRDARYTGLVSVELPRHSHAATATARHGIEFLHRTATALPPQATGDQNRTTTVGENRAVTHDENRTAADGENRAAGPGGDARPAGARVSAHRSAPVPKEVAPV